MNRNSPLRKLGLAAVPIVSAHRKKGPYDTLARLFRPRGQSMHSYPRLLAERPYSGRDQVLSIFANMANAPGAVLLDGGSNTASRFDLCAALPVTDLTQQCASSAPFDTLRQAWLHHHRAQTKHSLPFSGGLIAAFSYDLGRALAPLPQTALADLSVPDIIGGIYLWAVIINHETSHCGLWQFGELNEDVKEQAFVWFNAERPVSMPAFVLNGDWQANMNRAQYGTKFRRVKDYLLAGDCYQINLAQRFSAPFSGHPFSAYRRLSGANKAPFSAYINGGHCQILSLSPERFIAVNNHHAITEPIKGTRPRSSDAAIDRELKNELQLSEKDRAENVMIVDLLRNDFGKNCATGSVKVPELFAIRTYPAVHHLVSTITGTLADNRDALHLLEGAFPGGSITGAPKFRAMQIIEELEPHRRSSYCGSIGYYDFNRRMDSNIAIRTVVCEANQIHCWAGGGLVADSNEQMEYDETLHKVSKLLPLLKAMHA